MPTRKNKSLEMDTPVTMIWDDVLMLPIVGVVDSQRAHNIMEAMLNTLAETESKVVILDIQGVPAVDTAVANYLIKITQATQLMGATCIVSGISPAIAQTLVQLGIPLSQVISMATLKDALAHAFRKLGLSVVQTSEECN